MNRTEVCEDILYLLTSAMWEEPDRPYGNYYKTELENGERHLDVVVDTTRGKYPIISAGDDVTKGVYMGHGEDSVSLAEFLEFVYKKLGI